MPTPLSVVSPKGDVVKSADSPMAGTPKDVPTPKRPHLKPPMPVDPKKVASMSSYLEPLRKLNVEAMEEEAVSHEAAGNFEAAEKLRMELIDHQRKVVPAAQVQLGRYLLNMGKCLTAQENHPDAEQFYRESFYQSRKVLPADHPFMASCAHLLGKCLEAQGRWEEAEPIFRHAVAILRKHSNLPLQLAEALNSYAMSVNVQDKYSQAEQLWQEAYGLWQKYPPEKAADIPHVLTNLAYCIEEQGRVKEAETWYRQALIEMRKLEEFNHKDIAFVLSNLANCIEDQGRPADAEEVHRDVVEERKKLQPADPVGVASALSNLAACLQAQNRKPDAEPVYREALDIVSEHLPPGHPTIQLYVARLQHLLKQLGREEEAVALGKTLTPAY